MKRADHAVAILLALLVSLNTIQAAYADDEVLDVYYRSLTDLNNNEAEQIIMGAIEAYNELEPISIVSMARLDLSSLRILRNAIYALHGYEFGSEDLYDYFSEFAWYDPRYGNVDNQLSNVDRTNIERIRAFEARDWGTKTVQWGEEIVGVWQLGFGLGAGWQDRFVFHGPYQMEFLYSQMSELPMVQGLEGGYSISGEVLLFYVEMVRFYEHSAMCEPDPISGHIWQGTTEVNTAYFERPILLEFPIGPIELDGSFGVPEVTIGGARFYRMQTDPSYPY
jgi:hypothetical protein